MAYQVKNPRVTEIGPRVPEKAKLRVAAYARVSSDSADQLNSYLAQVDYYTRHIGENPDWELADIYGVEAAVVFYKRQSAVSISTGCASFACKNIVWLTLKCESTFQKIGHASKQSGDGDL